METRGFLISCAIPAAFYKYRESLNQFSRALTAISRQERLLESLVETVQDIFSVNSVALLLKDEQGDFYRLRSCVGLSPDLISQYRFPAMDGLVGRLFRDRRPLRRHQAPEDFPLEEAIQIQKEMNLVEAEIALPLFWEGKQVGVLAVGGSALNTEFRDEDLEHLLILARYAAAAISNSQAMAVQTAGSKLMDRLADALGTGLIAVDEEGVVLYVNETGAELLGLSSSAVAHHSIQKVSSVFADLLLRVIRRGETVQNHHLHDPATDKRFIVTTGSVPDDSGGRGAVVHFGVDTSRAEVPAERKEVRIDWSRVAEGIAHEIKNPLVSIRTFSQLLPERHEDVKFREEFSKVVTSEVDRLDAFVEELVTFSEPISFDMGWGNIHDTLLETISLFETRFASGSVQVVQNFDPNPPEVWFDPDMMAYAFSRVFDNILTAMPDGGCLTVSSRMSSRTLSVPKTWGTARPKKRSRLPADNSKEEVMMPGFEIEFRHTGLIPELEAQKAIFEPFGVRWPSGSGLSLPNARRIIEQHRGHITFHPAEAAGGAAIKALLPAKGNLVE